jgi:hypothetical protein
LAQNNKSCTAREATKKYGIKVLVHEDPKDETTAKSDKPRKRRG